jgi:antitoxin (DNA-binding transcriptional repressor) of toxin-antitoxin stability system
MSSNASVRDLRNHFPKIRKLIEADGEVVLTEKGQPRYRLTLYTPPSAEPSPAIDYWKRLNSYHDKPLTAAQARKLNDENRGDR